MNNSNQNTFNAFSDAWHRNDRGGWPARWHRLGILPTLVIQKLGLHQPVRVPLFWGERMQVLTGETISRGIISFGFGEPAITALLCELMQPGSLVVDIGTHFGYEAMLMARLTGEGGAVHAFEPNPEVRAFAGRNLARHSQVQLHACALSDQAGTAQFALPALIESGFGGLGGHPSSARKVEVELQTLDQVLAGRPRTVSVIKCDAEGHEEAILRGAAKLIETDRPALILETGMANEAGLSAPGARQIASLLATSGYAPFTFEFDKELVVGPLDSFPFGHASTLYLHRGHPCFAPFTAGYRRRAA